VLIALQVHIVNPDKSVSVTNALNALRMVTVMVDKYVQPLMNVFNAKLTNIVLAMMSVIQALMNVLDA
jgi:nitrate reductase NapAB chaperone NapD